MVCDDSVPGNIAGDDADEQALVDSHGPIGNIGFMLGYESKRHFRKMLEDVCQVLTENEMSQLIESLRD